MFLRSRPAGTSVLAASLLAAGLLAGCGSSSHAAPRPKPAASYAGAVANPPFPARPLKLRNWDGKRFDLASMRGKAVLVTFIYDHCPDTCPLIVGHLHTAQAELGAQAKKLQIVAVSVDPRGDTPNTVPAFLRARQMLGRMDYLIGSSAQLAPVWQQWGIAAKADPKSPSAVAHSALIYGISAKGLVTTLYPSNFQPSQIVHDVPMLAAQ